MTYDFRHKKNARFPFQAHLYDLNANELTTQLMKYRSRKRACKSRFRKFSDMAKYILRNLSDAEYRLLKSIVGTLLVLPFCTEDCERAFSAMNRIKTFERNRLKDILKSLMSAYKETYEGKANLDITNLDIKMKRKMY